MLNSAEGEILNAHKYIKNNQEIMHFSNSDKPRMLFFLLIKIEMPIVVGISTHLFAGKISYSAKLSMKKV